MCTDQSTDVFKVTDNRRWRNNPEMSEETWARVQRQNEGGLRETPDDTMFRWLAMSYAHSHLTMTETYRGSCHGDDVTGGQAIVNRASWKPVVGSKCSVTLEVELPSIHFTLLERGKELGLNWVLM